MTYYSVLFLFQDTDICSCSIPSSSAFREKYFNDDEHRLTRKQKKAKAAKKKEIWFAKSNNINLK